MTKLVPLRTIEHGLRRALSILDEDGACGAIEELSGVRRSASLLRKCADPDNDRHHLQLRYAIALDVACTRAINLAPLLEVYRYLVEHHAQGAPGIGRAMEAKLLRAVLGLQAALGELSQTVNEALHAESPGGRRLTNQERHAVHEALEAIDQESERIKRLLVE